MTSTNAREIPQPHWVLQCCYQDLYELMDMHFTPYSKGRPTPEIVSLQNRVEELEDICDLDVTDFEYIFNQERVDPLTDEELNMFQTLKRKMPESFVQVNASEFFNTILTDKYNRMKSEWLVKNSIVKRTTRLNTEYLEKKDVLEKPNVLEDMYKEGGLSPYTNLDEVFPPHSSQSKKERLRKKLERRMKLIEKYS